MERVRYSWRLLMLVWLLCMPLLCAACAQADVATQVPTVDVVWDAEAIPATTPAPTPTPTPTPIPTPTPTPTPSGLLGGRFADLLTTETVETEQSYGCPDFYISVTTHTDSEHVYTMDPRQSLTYHVADVYLQDVTLLRTGCAGETFFERWTEATTVEMAERYNALLAVSGDYFIHHGDNFVLRNGELIWENHPKRDICVLYRDGSLETFGQKEYDEKEVLASDPWQIWSFGPSLLDKEGQPIASFLSDVTAPNPRCVLGYYEPGHYCFVVVDGRIDGYSDGISMEMLSKLMFDLGCVAAYNLDGGGTAHMQWRSEMYSRQRYSPRPLSDIIYIAYPAS